MSDPNQPQEGIQASQPPYAPPPPPGAPYADPGVGQPPKKKGGAGKIIGIIAGVVVVLLIACGVIGYFALGIGKNSAANAKQGDCLAGDDISGGTTTASLTVTECTSSKARYKVVGLVANKSKSEASSQGNELCQPFVAQGAELLYWQESSRGSGTGNLLCLAKAK
jgi:hypothetical protein